VHASGRPGRRAGRGTKNPDVGKIIALCPDLVLANAEENRLPDLDALRGAGFAVYVTDIRTFDAA
jgi:ABC-type Fe3+-hydroxamate transport system substrate-binding protein